MASKLTINIITIISVVLAFLTLYCQIDNRIGYNLAILPFCFSILLIISYRLIRPLILKNPGLTILIIILFFRYTVLPYKMCDTGMISIFTQDSTELDNGVSLMVYEMIWVFLGIYLFYSKIRSIPTSNYTISKRLWHNRQFIIIATITAIVILWLTNPDLIGGISLITKGVIEDPGIITEKSSLATILWTILTTWLYVFLVLTCSAKYNRDKANKRYLTYSVVYTLLFILITYISQEEISRWHTLMCSLGGINLLVRCFADKKKLITIYIVVPVSMLMISATMFKNFSESTLTGNSEETMFITTLDAYLAGPSSVSNSIAMKDKNMNVGFESLGYDLLNNMPIVNHYIDTKKSTVYLYNLFLGRILTSDGRGDQIIPLIGQGCIYFGYILAPLLSILCIYFISYFDAKYTKSSGYYTYLFAFISCFIAVAPVLNLTIILSNIYIRIIPLLLFFLIAKKI